MSNEMKMSPNDIHYCLETLAAFEPSDIESDDFEIAVNDDQFGSMSIVRTAQLGSELIKQITEENRRLIEHLEVAKREVEKLSKQIDALDVWIENESSCAEWVSIDVIRSRLNKIYGRASRLLSKIGGE
uniref:Uncharacterized protein n=1 Tax=Enterovibrio sp. FF_113 TaxID=1660266 RepID=A0A0H3ZW68_9GAMM|nr:hypothetical protein [Enterovibrio sp. FF_113]